MSLRIGMDADLDPLSEVLPCEKCRLPTEVENLHLGICSECGTSPTICRRCNEPCWLRDLNDDGACCEPREVTSEEELHV